MPRGRPRGIYNTPHQPFRKIAQHAWLVRPNVTVLFLFGDSPSMLDPETKAYFGSFSFQTESAMSLHLVRFTHKNRDLYPIGLMRIFIINYYINIIYMLLSKNQWKNDESLICSNEGCPFLKKLLTNNSDICYTLGYCY